MLSCPFLLSTSVNQIFVRQKFDLIHTVVETDLYVVCRLVKTSTSAWRQTISVHSGVTMCRARTAASVPTATPWPLTAGTVLVSPRRMHCSYKNIGHFLVLLDKLLSSLTETIK